MNNNDMKFSSAQLIENLEKNRIYRSVAARAACEYIKSSGSFEDCVEDIYDHIYEADDHVVKDMVQTQKIITELENILDKIVETGDNAAEFSILMLLDYFENFKNQTSMIDFNTYFLNVSDYIAQEHELKARPSSEEEILETEVMRAFYNMKHIFEQRIPLEDFRIAINSAAEDYRNSVIFHLLH